MFTSYDITRALVAERHTQLRREAGLDRLARSARRARRAAAAPRSARSAIEIDARPPTASAGAPQERAAA